MAEKNCFYCGATVGHDSDCPNHGRDAVNPTHYDGKGMQVWDIWDAFKCGVYEANIIKYILRHEKKNGVEDLKKARTYLDRLIAQEEARAKKIEELRAELSTSPE